MIGSNGWDAYAPFYDWENAQTFGRRDVKFWTDFAKRAGGRTLELGCGTGRLLMPLARSGARVTGIDLSAAMLERAASRRRRLPRDRRPAILRGDIRHLPFRSSSFSLVIAPYGMLQSLTTDADLDAALDAARRVLKRGGWLGVDLVPDLPTWDSYRRQVRLRGRERTGATVTLIESVRQDRRRGLTIFDEEFTRTLRGHTSRHRFSLTFRTLSMTDTIARIERAGFRVESVMGDYAGRPWSAHADVWLIVARKARSGAGR